MKIKWFILLLILLIPPSVSAQYVSAKQGEDLTLKLAVIGPGNQLYFWWGHIGLIVEDRSTGESWFFDWGVFSFDTENFFLNFAFGRLVYSCMASMAEPYYNHYIRTNRDITLYTLDLPPEKKEEILLFAAVNMLPENRDYLYHHFYDNCATRIRDIIDLGLDGQFKAKYSEIPSRFTLRQQVRRHTWFSPFFDWILNFWMGQVIDVPMTVWDDMFLPSEIGKHAADFSYIDPDGNERSLVSNIETIFLSSGRPIVLDEPRLQWPRNLIAGLLFSSFLVIVSLKKGETRGFRIFAGLVQSFFGLFLGIAGSMLFFMMFFTLHDYTFQNINIIYINPLFLAALPLGIIISFSKIEKRRILAIKISRAFWVYVFCGALITILIKVFPAFFQQNQVTQSMMIPLSLAMIFIFSLLERRLGKSGPGRI